MKPHVFAAVGLKKEFDDGRVQALRGVDISIAQGEFVAITGPSGCGKTTLLQMLGALDFPSSGTLHYRGNSIPDLPAPATYRAREIGIIFQAFHLLPTFTALENVQIPMFETDMRAAERKERADLLLAFECLERVGLLAQAGQRADTLSGGQQQRVAIARALAQGAELIIADEPVASLDPQTGTGILELLRAICHAGPGGVGVICSLHQPQFAKQFADRVVGLAGGRIVMDIAAAAFAETSLLNVYGTEGAADEARPDRAREYALV